MGRKRTSEEELEILEYYKTHSEQETLIKFRMGSPKFLSILDKYSVARRSAEENKKLTCLHKFGTSYAAQSLTVKQHHKDTCLEKYGVDNFAKSAQFGRKFRETCQSKYGVDNPMQSQEVVDRLKKTNQERYGVAWPQQSAYVVEKRCNTTKQKYGGVGWASPLIKAKYKKTCLKHYGTSHNTSSPIVKQHVVNSCLDKYGVMWPCMLPQVKKGIHKNSTVNDKFENLLNSHQIENYEREFSISRYSYDFKVGNTLIEINPTITHNSTMSVWKDTPPTSTSYHFDKVKLATDNGYRCMCVWDWDDSDKIIESLKSRKRIYARDCIVKSVTPKDARSFICKYHFQNYINSKIKLGLYYDGELVSIMTFGVPRYNKSAQYELLRYCSMYNVVGGAQKLLAHFEAEYKPTSIISYCDLSKFTGNVYTALGFKQVSCSISKHWYNMKTGRHITDNLLRQHGFDRLLGDVYGTFGKGTSNEDLMKQHGFLEVYDAGQATFLKTYNS